MTLDNNNYNHNNQISHLQRRGGKLAVRRPGSRRRLRRLQLLLAQASSVRLRRVLYKKILRVERQLWLQRIRRHRKARQAKMLQWLYSRNLQEQKATPYYLHAQKKYINNDMSEYYKYFADKPSKFSKIKNK